MSETRDMLEQRQNRLIGHLVFQLICLSVCTSLYADTDLDAGLDASYQPVSKNACVILLHGLARTDKSMKKMARALVDDGYHVINYDYPSREYGVAKLSELVIPDAVADCRSAGSQTIHFVTHSLGGIIIRYYLSEHELAGLGRVVMLSPPNKGSETIDKLAGLPGFIAFHGPAGRELGTGKQSIPKQLGPVDYEVGVITGNKSINLFLSLMIPGDDDGKVSIENAKLAGMADFLVLPEAHPFIMKSQDVIEQTKHFLKTGEFSRKFTNGEP